MRWSTPYQVHIAQHGACSEAPITLLYQLLQRYRLINSIGNVPREVERCESYRKPAIASSGEIQVHVQILKSYGQPNQPLPTRSFPSGTQLHCLGHVTDSTDRFVCHVKRLKSLSNTQKSSVSSRPQGVMGTGNGQNKLTNARAALERLDA